MPKAYYDDARKRWVIDGQKDGVRKIFTSTKKGLSGKREVISKYEAWRDYGGDNPAPITVEKAVELFLEDVCTRYGKDSESYRGAEIYTRVYILPAFRYKAIASVKLSDWQSLINHAKPHSNQTEVLSKKTLKNLRSVINRLQKYCYNNYYTEAWRGELYIPEGHPTIGKEILQPADIQRLFEPSNLWYHPAFLVMLVCGLRPGECLGLQVNDIKDGIIHVRRAINDSNQITHGKNRNAIRDVPAPKQALEIINKTIERNKSCGLQTKWIFCGYSGEHGNQSTMRTQWYILKRERDLPGCPYALRHTFVSIVSAQSHISEGNLKMLLGHSKDMDTYGVYAHTVDSQLLKISAEIDTTFEKIRKAAP